MGDLVKAQFKPSPQQLAVTDKLIESMDLNEKMKLDEGDPRQLARPNKTFNPALDYFYQTLQHKALHPDSDVLPIISQVKSEIDPNPQVLQRAKPALDEYRNLFPFHRAPEAKAGESKRRVWSEAFLKDKDINLDSYVGGDGAQKKFKATNEKLSLESLIGGVETVGPLNPVEDFRVMFKRRDVDLVDKAVREMKALIYRLVSESVKSSHYAKALECVLELRVGCAKEDEGVAFNELLSDLKRLCVTQRRQADFWKLLVQNKITLLTREEAVDSDVTQEDASKFLEADEDAMDIDEAMAATGMREAVDEENADDLLRMIQ
jgi:ATP-dependent DNA helicase 2 subunit 2